MLFQPTDPAGNYHKIFVDAFNYLLIYIFVFRENSMAITPDGKLTLCVSPSLHDRLGLEAIRSEQLDRKRGFNPVRRNVSFSGETPKRLTSH